MSACISASGVGDIVQIDEKYRLVLIQIHMPYAFVLHI